MPAKTGLAVSWVLAALSVAAPAQTAQSVNLTVKETGGLRRFGFPVNARVSFPKGALSTAANARLVLNETETPAQLTAESQWPDGSVQSLAVDFNATIGPRESQTYRIEYGEGVAANAKVNGLTVTEDADGIQVGNVRWSKSGNPLLASVKYRGEVISAGLNGIAVTDAAGASHDLSSAMGMKVEVVKRGPIYVVIRYSGRLPVDAQYSVPFEISCEMPNSKSWVKISATVDDPARRLRELAFNTPLTFGPLPWVWDFGTEHWTYGALRTPTDSVLVTQNVKATGTADWQVSSGAKGKEQTYETADQSKPIAWAHIQGAKEVVAFAIENVAREPGAFRIATDGAGQTSFRFAPATPTTRHHLTVYEHFVATPVQIGAATSPASILSPLIVEVSRASSGAR